MAIYNYYKFSKNPFQTSIFDSRANRFSHSQQWWKQHNSSLTSNGTLKKFRDAVLWLDYSSLKDVSADPVKAPDASLKCEVLLLVIGRGRTEDGTVEACHEVLLDIVQQQI